MRLPFAPRRHEVIPRPLPPMHVCDKHPSALGRWLYVQTEGFLDILLCGHCAQRYGPAIVGAGFMPKEVM